MEPASITQYITVTFTGVDVVRPEEHGGPEIAWGDTFFIYDPWRDLAPNRQFPFATIVTKDYGDFDRVSNQDRPGVLRLNVGVSRETYQSLFVPPLSPHGTPGAVDPGHDFAALARLLPHPVYAAQSWVCVLNPSDATFQTTVQPLLAEA
jgi:Family of unknown function (DUF6194)